MESTKSIGICPICGQGHITEHPFGWACDNSKKNDDGTWYNCKFVVFRQYHGANITEEDVKTLLATGETGELQMCNKEGKPFIGKLVIKEGKVQLAFPPRYLEGRCPVCGGRIKVTGKGYACENFFKKDDGHCNFFISSTLCNRVITPVRTSLRRMTGTVTSSSVAHSVTGSSRNRRWRTSWQERNRFLTASVPRQANIFRLCCPPRLKER